MREEGRRGSIDAHVCRRLPWWLCRIGSLNSRFRLGNKFSELSKRRRHDHMTRRLSMPPLPRSVDRTAPYEITIPATRHGWPQPEGTAAREYVQRALIACLPASASAAAGTLAVDGSTAALEARAALTRQSIDQYSDRAHGRNDLARHAGDNTVRLDRYWRHLVSFGAISSCIDDAVRGAKTGLTDHDGESHAPGAAAGAPHTGRDTSSSARTARSPSRKLYVVPMRRHAPRSVQSAGRCWTLEGPEANPTRCATKT